MAVTTHRPRWLWPWLHAGGLGLIVADIIFWNVEFYLYVASVYLGGPLFFLTFAGLVINRAVRHRRPWMDRPALALAGVMMLAHGIALAMFRTINWC